MYLRHPWWLSQLPTHTFPFPSQGAFDLLGQYLKPGNTPMQRTDSQIPGGPWTQSEKHGNGLNHLSYLVSTWALALLPQDQLLSQWESWPMSMLKECLWRIPLYLRLQVRLPGNNLRHFQRIRHAIESISYTFILTYILASFSLMLKNILFGISNSKLLSKTVLESFTKKAPCGEFSSVSSNRSPGIEGNRK